MNARTTDARQRTSMQNFMQHGRISAPPAEDGPVEPMNDTIAEDGSVVIGDSNETAFVDPQPASARRAGRESSD